MTRTNLPYDAVPTRIVAREIRLYAHKFNQDHSAPTSDASYDFGYHGAYRMLADRAGMSKAMLEKVAQEKYLTCAFETADKILTALGLAHLWWEDPELRQISSAQVKAADKEGLAA